MDSKRSISRGFTFIEILVVLLVLGIVSMIALPTLQGSIEESKLSGAAGEITVAITYAQVTAMTTGAETRVIVDTAGESIVVERFQINGDVFGGGNAMAENDIETGDFVTMAHPTNRGEDYIISFGGQSRFDGVDITAADFGGNPFITFDAMGIPSNGGIISLSLGSRVFTLSVNPSTGRITSN